MIEKLNDQMIIEMAWEHYFGAKNRVIAKTGMRKARDYYDAQIDAQAKTMEELWSIFVNLTTTKQGNNAYNFALKEIEKLKKRSGNSELDFSICIEMFLAAGGVIK
jgi:hypothetical protein